MDRTNGAGNVAGKFVAEDLATNRPPTEITADWLNGVQEELVAVLLAANVQPDRLKLNQLKLALDATYLAQNGTSPILQNFAGLTRSLTPINGGLVREYVDIPNAATVGGIEIGNVYNCPIDTATGVWAGRDIADFCWLEKWHDTAGTKEFWFAPTAAAGTVPVWQLVSSLTAATGALAVAGSITAAPATGAAQLSTLGQSDARYLPLAGNPAQVVSVAPATLPAHAVRFDQAFGLGQSWSNVTASRALNTAAGAYINSTGKIKKVMVQAVGTVSVGSSVLTPTVAGVVLPRAVCYVPAANQGWDATTAFEVPPGATYSVAGAGNTLGIWVEL